MSICIKFRNIVLNYRTGCRGDYEFPVTCEKELFLLFFFLMDCKRWNVRNFIKGIGRLLRMMERRKIYFSFDKIVTSNEILSRGLVYSRFIFMKIIPLMAGN